MSSPTERRRNSLRVGVFVFMALVLAMAVIIFLSDISRFFERPNHYQVTFDVAAGVQDLGAGSAVRVGGLTRGRVESVELETAARSVDPDTRRSDRVVVRFTLDRTIPLYEDPLIRVQGSVLGAESWLQITDLGGGGGAAPRPLGPDVLIEGAGGGGGLLGMLGEDAGRTLDLLNGTLEAIRSRIDAVEEDELKLAMENLTAGLEGFRDASADAKAFLERANTIATDLEGDWARWSTTVDDVLVAEEGEIMEILATLRSIANEVEARVEQTGLEVEAFMKKANMAGTQANELLATANQEILAFQERDIVGKLDRAIEDGRSAMGGIRRVLDRVEEDLPGWSVNIGETLVAGRQSAQQLELLMMEIRRNPWKVLYQPSGGELAHEQLYEATRSFAYAATDLTAASDTVERMLELHDGDLGDPELAARVRATLLAPLERFERAERRLYEAITELPGSTAAAGR